MQKGQTVLTIENWYNLKKACTNIISTSYAQSTMIYGNQWDEVMSWLKTTKFASDPSKVDSNSRSWGNYEYSTGAAKTGSGTKRTSGYNEAWQANNIYDLAGNCMEWTQEAHFEDYRGDRGGDWNDYGNLPFNYPVSARNGDFPDDDSSDCSRPTMYIK